MYLMDLMSVTTGCARSISLDGEWQVAFCEDDPGYLLSGAIHDQILVPAAVPGTALEAVVAAGMLGDPLFGMNSLQARWVEEQFWSYRRTFEAGEAALGGRSWLCFDCIDHTADVYLNGELVGHHANAHRPARIEVTGKLRPDTNLLVVLVESGAHATNDKAVSGYGYEWTAQMTRRPLLRKPQYQSGWDWNPHLVNVGIPGGVRLEWSAGLSVEELSVQAIPTKDLTAATIRLGLSLNGSKATATVTMRLPRTGQQASADVELPAEGRTCLEIVLEDPILWWPIGHGSQHLEEVTVVVEAGDDRFETARRVGVRSVEMEQEPHPVEGSTCVLKVNGRPIFCKGGNWVPPDALYGRVTADHYRKLVQLSVEANFNMLRVWGGGTYAEPALCQACDEAGVMLWHDLLFACAKYPGDDPAFAGEVEVEVRAALRARAHHPSLVVWCGNNEIEWGDAEWGYSNRQPVAPHYYLFHRVLPRVAKDEAVSSLYWLSSPWSPGLEAPNSPIVGDQHPWGVSIMQPGGADFWLYRSYVDRFPNEGGVLGASTPATLRQFLPAGEQRVLSPSWVHHDNPLATRGARPGDRGRAYDTVILWTGREPAGMSLEEYSYTSGLLHAEGLTEYIRNYRRRMFSSASAIFWMYNDSWPVTHGWTIVDYYLRKKLAYHPVRRAFAPVCVVAWSEGDTIHVTGVNDTPADWSGVLSYGLFTLAGERPVDAACQASVPANSAVDLAQFSRGEWDRLGLDRSGVFAVLSGPSGSVDQHRLFEARFGDLKLATANIRIERAPGRVTLVSDVFQWGVCLDTDGDSAVPDNCFDLIPGVGYTLDWSDALGDPHVVRTANR